MEEVVVRQEEGSDDNRGDGEGRRRGQGMVMKGKRWMVGGRKG